MSTMCGVIIIWICAFGIYRKTASARKCYVADFGEYYMDNSLKPLWKLTERYSAAKTAALYAKYISKMSKRLFPIIRIPDLISTRPYTPPEVVNKVHKLHVSLVKDNTTPSCTIDSIATEMHNYNKDRAVGSDACIVGTNLRKIDHLYTLVLEASLADIRIILNFFLPEFKNCWSTPHTANIAEEFTQYYDLEYLKKVIFKMRKVAADLRLRQNIKYFQETKLALRHIVKYVPTNELEHTQDGHVKITAAFHRLMKFIEDKSMKMRVAFQEKENNENVNNEQVRSLLFAVVANAEHVESYLPSGDADYRKFSGYVAERVMQRMIKILAIPFNIKAANKIVAKSNSDITGSFLLLIHGGHHGQVYLESMLVEFVRLGIKISNNADGNEVTISNICATLLAAMFNVQATSKGVKERTTTAKFFENLVTHFDESAVSQHFETHAGPSKKTLWSRIKSHFRPSKSKAADSDIRDSPEFQPTSPWETSNTVTSSKSLDDADNDNVIKEGESIEDRLKDGTSSSNKGDDTPLDSSLDGGSADHQEKSAIAPSLRRTQSSIFPLQLKQTPATWSWKPIGTRK